MRYLLSQMLVVSCLKKEEGTTEGGLAVADNEERLTPLFDKIKRQVSDYLYLLKLMRRKSELLLHLVLISLRFTLAPIAMRKMLRDKWKSIKLLGAALAQELG